MFNFFIKYWQQIQQFFLDIKNRKQFKEDIQNEIDDPKSKYNGLHLNASDDRLSVTALVDLPSEYQLAGTDTDKQNKLKNEVKVVTQYLAFDLEWAEYLSIPEFYYLEDPNSDMPSRTYVAVWSFTPYILNSTRFYIKVGVTLLLLAAAIILPIVLL